MNLQEAQWAVLQNNNQLYQQSLKHASQNIERVFENNTQATQSLVKQLQALQQKPLHIKKPVIDQSLQLLNQVINSNINPRPLPAASAGDKTP